MATMPWCKLFAFALLLSAVACRGESSARTATVVRQAGSWAVTEGQVSLGAAWAVGSRREEEGWELLDLAISSRQPADAATHSQSMFALGYLEAYFTCDTMNVFYTNYKKDLFGPGGTPDASVLKFVEDNYNWMMSEVEGSAPGSEDHSYWQAVGDVMAQFDGMLQGHRAFCPWHKPMTVADLILLNMLGDLYDVMPAVDSVSATGVPRKFSRRSGMPLVRPGDRPSRCSSAIRLQPGEKDGEVVDIAVGHTTWDGFTNGFPRTYKHITLYPRGRRGAPEEAYTESFSSSPGLLSSMDDFYITSGSSSLFVMETSLDVLDDSKYRAVTAKSVLCWVRVIVANRLARDAQEWAQIFSRLHSGTYNNQWMIVDRSRFEPASSLPSPGLFWLLEEAPGAIVSDDLSEKLWHDGYWGSYNVPYFQETRDALGFKDSRGGDEHSHAHATRARQFRHLIPKAEGLEGMHWLMRWNGWGHKGNEDIGLDSPAKAIASRGDLVPAMGGNASGTNDVGRRRGAWGAIDSKVASWSAWEASRGPAAVIQLGPTTQDQDPFCWNDELFASPHEGHPACFDFDQVAVPMTRFGAQRAASNALGSSSAQLVSAAEASSSAWPLPLPDAPVIHQEPAVLQLSPKRQLPDT